MKSIIRILLAVVVFTAFATKTNAQVMAKKPEWITIKSANLKCWTCKQRLEEYMNKESVVNYESGIAQIKFNLLQGEVKIQYYPDRITPEDIRLIINNAGFDADTEKATPDSYKKLPLECKYASEGGGPQKGKPCHTEPN